MYIYAFFFLFNHQVAFLIYFNFCFLILFDSVFDAWPIKLVLIGAKGVCSYDNAFI